MLSLLAILLLAGSVLGQPTPSPPSCDSCADGACEVRDNIKVKSLCAQELCVNGQPVIVGDGNPCTLDEIIDGKPVHTKQKDCCRSNLDCEEFIPGPCYTTSCFKENSTAVAGYCVHTHIPAPECCAAECDCPDKPCFTKSCDEVEEGAAVFAHIDKGKHGLTLIRTHEAVVRADRECVYTPVEDDDPTATCCTEDSECECPNGDLPTCISNKCHCLPGGGGDCRRDSDCQTGVDQANCARTGLCYTNKCVSGTCECKQSLNADADGDGVPCREDCNDLDDSVNATIFCPVGVPADFDKDNDGIPECGVYVKEVCNTTCPTGVRPVNATDVERSKRDWKKFFIAYNCDCCSGAPGPDELTCCGRDLNGNGFFELQNETSASPCCVPTCVSVNTTAVRQGGRGHSEPSLADRNRQCAIANGNDADFVFVPEENRGPLGTCDQCDGTEVEDGEEEEQPAVPQDCPKRINDGVADTVVCDTGLDITECCAQILDVAEQNEGANEISDDFQAFVDCCRNETDDCFPGDEAFPLEADVCDCDDETRLSPCEPVPNDNKICHGKIEFTGEAGKITCVFDRDHDGYYNCKDNTTVCVRTPVLVDCEEEEEESDTDSDDGTTSTGDSTTDFTDPDDREEVCEDQDSDCQERKKGRGNKKGPKPYKPKKHDFCKDLDALLDLDPSDPDDEDTLCKLHFGDRVPVSGYQKALNEQNEGDVESGDFDGTYCDCDDGKTSAHQLIVCLEDKDNDGAPYCPAFPEGDRVAKCSEPKCAGECPSGFVAPQDVKDVNGESVCSPVCDKKKRSTGASLADLKANAEQHAWFGTKGGHGHGHHDGDDELPPREDQECGDGFECDFCDCCDKDCAVYERNEISFGLGMPAFASSEPTKCGGYNYQCDITQVDTTTVNDIPITDAPFAVCPGTDKPHKDCERSGRPLFSVYDLESDPLSPELNNQIYPAYDGVEQTEAATTTQPDSAGSTGTSPSCIAKLGWSPESTAGGDDKRKRNGGHNDNSIIAPLCKSQIQVQFASVSNSSLVSVTTPPRLLRAGDCIDFIEGATKNPSQSICHPDCEMCLRVIG